MSNDLCPRHGDKTVRRVKLHRSFGPIISIVACGSLHFRPIRPASFLFFSCKIMFNSAIPRTSACQASLSFTISWNLLKLMSIESVMPSNHLIFCWPLLLSSIFPSIRVFSNELALWVRWPKYWSFIFNISPFNEYLQLILLGLIGLLSLQSKEFLKSLLQHHNSNTSILGHSAFFMSSLISNSIWNSTFPHTQIKVLGVIFSSFPTFGLHLPHEQIFWCCFRNMCVEPNHF